MTTEEFITKARAVHGDKYDYSKVVYVNNITKVCIICPEHGEFLMTAKKHLRGYGCSQCHIFCEYTYEECYTQALKFSSIADFSKSNVYMYDYANRRKWTNDYTWFEKKWEKKWDRNTCFIEAQKYNSRGSFKNGCPTAYTSARKNGWLIEYTWFSTPIKKVPHGYWTYENCLNEAKKYTSKVEFAKNNNGAYQAAIKNHWMKFFKWLKPAFRWSPELCIIEAKKYISKTDFRKANPNAYDYAIKAKLINSYFWFQEKRKPNGFWSYERCSNEALKYKTKAEFKKGNASAHSAAQRNGWLDDWFNNEHFNILGKIDCVYCYLFKEFNTVYVGRTLMRRKNIRDREHIYSGDRDKVTKFAKQKNCAVPPMTILEDKLTITEGQDREEYWRQKYAEEGYYILNTAATGIGKGSLGTLDNGKWNKESCFSEAKKYRYLRDFEQNSASACAAARRNGWIKDYEWLIFLGKKEWNKEDCEQEARKYKTRKMFQKGSPSAYNKARINGWLNEYSWMPKRNLVTYGYWDNYKNCYNEAKKYQSRSEFQRACQGAYDKARINKWIDDYTWFKKINKPNGYWNQQTCFDEAKKWKTITAFAKNAVRAYQLAHDNGWIKDYIWFEKKLNWTYNLCKEKASLVKKRSEFKDFYPGAYSKSRINGWLDDFFPKKEC